jgi:hypothetical protein
MINEKAYKLLWNYGNSEVFVRDLLQVGDFLILVHQFPPLKTYLQEITAMLLKAVFISINLSVLISHLSLLYGICNTD